ncbi:Uma2 family endonuclease [Hydrogenimonas sp.]
MPAIDYDLMPHYTYDDYKGWEGGWELIDGIPYNMAPAPYPKHQWLVAHIWRELDANLDCSDETCTVYLAPIDWKIDETTVVQPDVALFCEAPGKPYFSHTPPIVVEVLFLSTALKDMTTKKALYERAGVRHYLIADPDRKHIDHFELVGGAYHYRGRFRDERIELAAQECRSAIDTEVLFG